MKKKISGDDIKLDSVIETEKILGKDENNRTFGGFKKDIQDENKKLEEASISYLGGNDLKF